MKAILGFIAVCSLASASSFAAGFSCQHYAEVVAVNAMNKQLKAEVAPRRLHEEEKAALSNSIFLDTNNEEVEVDTGIYGVEMGVMEECLDALKVTTKVVTVRGKKSCKVLSVESYGQRDCG